jgi:hypothetical protein
MALKIIVLSLTVFIVHCLSACGGSGSKKSDDSTSSAAVSSRSVQASSLSSSSSSSAIVSSSQASTFGSLVVSVNEKTIDEPILEVGNFPAVVEADDSVTIYWTAHSTDGLLNNIVWQQLTGPQVSLNPTDNRLLITFGQPGDVSLRATVTDNQNRTLTREITIKVVAPFSEKAHLMSGVSTGVGFDLVIVGDGFLDVDQAKFEQAAKETAEFLFDYDNKILNPYKPLVNVWTIESISTTRNIPDNSSGTSLFGSYFNCAGIERLLCVDFSKTMQFVSQHVPQYDQILVLVNSTRYGGAGGSMSTASLHSLSKDVVIHELGHSVANLADEYLQNDGQAQDTFEPFEPNVTINQDPRNVKWNYWYKDSQNIPGVDKFVFEPMDIGYFEGGKYHARGIWRPTEFSFMRDLGQPMGAVNAEAMAVSIWRYSDNTNLALPQQRIISRSEKPVVFYIQPLLEANNLQIQWWINNEPVAGNGNELFLVLSQIDESIQSVRVQMLDTTGLIRRHSSDSKTEYEWVTE